MASCSKDTKRNRYVVSIAAKDVDQAWGDMTPLSLIKQWVEIGRERKRNNDNMLSVSAQLEDIAQGMREDQVNVLDELKLIRSEVQGLKNELSDVKSRLVRVEEDNFKLQSKLEDLPSISSDTENLTELVANTAKLVSLMSASDHVNLEVYRAAQKQDKSTQEMDQVLIMAGIKEHNFDSLLEDLLPGLQANRLLSTTKERS